MTEILGPDAPGVHPVAAVFPLMEGSDFHDLIEDIRANGLREAIWMTPDGLILDGRNRWRACQAANVEPEYRTYDGDDLIEFVVSLNLKRRHLDETQRGMVAAKIANISLGFNQYGGSPNLGTHITEDDFRSKPPSVSIPKAAEMLNVGRGTVENAKIVLNQGADNVIKAVEQGEVSVSAAAKAVKAVNTKAGSPEAGKKLQSSWTIDDIKAEVKKAKEQEIVKTAQKAESDGEGNAVTEFMIREKRLPSPTEARTIAQRTGLGVVDSRGIIQPPVSLDRIESRAELDEMWGGLSDALEAITKHTAEELVDAIPSYQRDSVIRRLPAVISRLNLILELLNGDSDHAEAI